MKKSTLLSLLTAAAIVTTTAGTYAAWDQLDAHTSSTVTFTKPVTITAPSKNFTLNEKHTLGDTSASGDISFNIENTNDLAKGLKIVPAITSPKSSNFTISDFKFEITSTGNTKSNLTQGTSGGFIDTSLNKTNNYTVKVTPLKKEIAGQAFDFTLTATLIDQQTVNTETGVVGGEVGELK